MAPRKNPIARAGLYSAPIDSEGMSEDDKVALFGKARGKTGDAATDAAEKSFTGSTEAIRRARKANKQAPLKEY